MKISQVSFGRAFTTAEMKKWEDIKNEAKEELGLNETMMICFDSCMPSKKSENRGIGSSFSDDAIKFVDFMSKMTGMNTVQLQPQGRLAKGTNSPFSGTVFSIGEHIIDLKKLTSDKYENILPENDYKKALNYFSQSSAFEHVLDENADNMKALKTAFHNFEGLEETSPLKQEYNKFLKENKDWLEKEALYDCLTEKHNEGNWKKWSYADKFLFTYKIDNKERQKRIDEIKNDYKEKYDFTLFIQFIANKQLFETKAAYNKMGIKVAGDCLIGFSEKEHWANQEAFYSNCSLGCEDKHKNALGQYIIRQVDWGMPALNYDEIGTIDNLGPAGKLFVKKFEKFFKQYDTLRIDAAWQLVKPHIVHTDYETGEKQRLDVPEQGDKLLKLMDSVLKKVRPNDYKTYQTNLELLGSSVYWDPVFKDRCQIHHSIYQHGTWGHVNFYKSKGLTEDNMTFGLGTHDDLNLMDVYYQKGQEQAPVLSKNLGLSEEKLANSLSDFTTAKFGEIFTTKNNFFTAFDALGVQKRINNQQNDLNNWRVRVSPDYEEEYFANVKNGLGLNLPAAYLVALNAKGVFNPRLVEKLEKANQILKQDGPCTIAKANEKFGADKSEL